MLRFEWEWESAPEVRAPELRATWATLRIDVGDVTATLVEDRSSRSGLRRRINVPTYPLAEWIAYNWWALTSPTPAGRDGFRFADAGDGFPWPCLTLRSGPGYTLAQLRPADRAVEAVRFLSGAELLLSPAAVELELRRFVEDTIQQLGDVGIVKTPLQEEWAEIASADEDVIAFCRTSAALGLDPFDLDDSETKLVLGLGSGIDDAALVAELAASTQVSDAESAHAWLREALDHIDSVTRAPSLALPFEPLPLGHWQRPWRVGYERAERVRDLLRLAPDERLDVEDLVVITAVQSDAPHRIAGLAQARGEGTAVAVPAAAAQRAKRFAGARAIGRRTFDDSRGGLLLTGRDEYVARVERAFAAEFLAPAAALERFLGDSTSDESLLQAAEWFDVSVRVIEHQLENRLGRSGI